MAGKIKLTRPELKRQRDMLARFQRYLPMLKLKQQQLQLAVRTAEQELRRLSAEFEASSNKIAGYCGVFNLTAGVNLKDLAEFSDIKIGKENIAGVNVPVFEEARFEAAQYSLISTPVWVDRALADLRARQNLLARMQVAQERRDILRRELAKTLQRVNLFEKVKIPESLEAMRVIRIHLGDEMTAAVGRAKIAKSKTAVREAAA